MCSHWVYTRPLGLGPGFQPCQAVGGLYPTAFPQSLTLSTTARPPQPPPPFPPSLSLCSTNSIGLGSWTKTHPDPDSVLQSHSCSHIAPTCLHSQTVWATSLLVCTTPIVIPCLPFVGASLLQNTHSLPHDPALTRVISFLDPIPSDQTPLSCTYFFLRFCGLQGPVPLLLWVSPSW